MAVMIRLQRQGARNRPEYQIVAIDKESKRDGTYLAKLGKYRPRAKDVKEFLQVDLEAIRSWQTRGALCSQTVGQLLKTLAK